MNNEDMTNHMFWEKNISTTPGDLFTNQRDFALSRKDDIKNMGFDYRGNILKKSLSAVLFSEVKRASMLKPLEYMLSYLVDSVKNIKKHSNFAIPKRWEYFN